MAKTKDEIIEWDELSEDKIIDSTNRNDTLYFKGDDKYSLEAVIQSAAVDKNDLILITTKVKNDSNIKIILQNYFAMNGKFPIKQIKTDTGYSDYKNIYSIYEKVTDLSYWNLSGDAQRIEAQNGKATGTVFNDIITGTVATKETLSGGVGNDTITGMGGVDVITGGTGQNTVVHAKGDGDDIINLTKGERLFLNFKDLTLDDLKYSYENKNKDLKISYSVTEDETTKTGSVTLKNFASKDVLRNPKEEVDTSCAYITIGNDTMPSVDLKRKQLEYLVNKSNFTGGWLNDFINASGSDELQNKSGKHVNMVLSGGAGNNKILGSAYADTIKGGIGDDEIDGGIIENDSNDDDTITGGAGNNIIHLHTADGAKFGNDTVVLTKGENLKFMLDAEGENTINYVNTEISGNDLKLYVYSSKDTHNTETLNGSITIKNYAKKDVITGNGSLLICDKNDSPIYDFRNDFEKITYMDAGEGHYAKQSYTGVWLDDYVDANGFKLYKNGNKITTDSSKGEEITTETDGFEKVKGVTINLGGSTNKNTAKGSIYADTIKGGANNDIIQAGKGNDTITGGAGANTIVHCLGDGDDIINLTKGEIFTLDFEGVAKNNLSYAYVNNKKDLKISYSVVEGEEEEAVTITGSVTLKNFASKDVTNNATKKTEDTSHVYIQFGESSPATELRSKFYTTEITDGSNYTGTWLKDNIDASKSTEKKNKSRKHVNIVLNGGAGDDNITGSAFADTIKGGAGSDIIYGQDGNDTIEGGNGDDYLYGEAGDDTIKAGAGNDIILGGAGDDFLYGEKGDDTFVFNKGDGKDILYSGKGIDTIKLQGVYLYDIFNPDSVSQSGKDLIIGYSRNEQDEIVDSITIKNYFTSTKQPKVNASNSFKTIQFEDITLDVKTLLNKIVIDDPTKIDGTDENDLIIAEKETACIINAKGGDDYLYASLDDDEMYGGDGNDLMYGSDGADTICGGAGNDNINAGSGDDTIYSYLNESTKKELTEGIIVNISGGADNDSIYAQSETNIIKDTSGSDKYYAYIDQNTTITDTESGSELTSDELHITNTWAADPESDFTALVEGDDGEKSNLNIVFNVSKNYTVDLGINFGDAIILNSSNIDLWKTQSTYNGVTITDNTVETIYSSDNYSISNTDIANAAQAVSAWLTSDGRDYDSVNAVLEEGTNVEALLSVFAENINWNSPNP